MLLVQVCIPSQKDTNRITVSIYLPEEYPSSAAPVLELYGGCMSAQQQTEAIEHMHKMFQPGEVSSASLAHPHFYWIC